MLRCRSRCRPRRSHESVAEHFYLLPVQDGRFGRAGHAASADSQTRADGDRIEAGRERLKAGSKCHRVVMGLGAD